MKKFLLLAACIGMALTGCSGGENSEAVEKYGSDTLKLFNWGEYMGENLISDFGVHHPALCGRSGGAVRKN